MIYSRPIAYQVSLAGGAKTTEIKYSSHDGPKPHWLETRSMCKAKDLLEMLKISLTPEFAAEKKFRQIVHKQ